MIISYNGLILNNNGNLINFPITTGGLPPPPPPPIELVTSGLTIYLDASDILSYSGGSIWYDLSGNNNNALISGATWSSTDGGLFDFNGVNNTMSITHNSNLSLTTTTQRTIQMWVKFDTLPTNPNRMIFFGKLSSAFAFDGYWGGVNYSGGTEVATNGTSIAKVSRSTLSLSTNTWYLFTFISQITATANTTKVYVNNVEYITTSHGSDGYSESNNLTIGYLTPPLAGLGQISYLDGKVGDVYFYNRGLSVSEVSNNYDATKVRFGL